MAWWVGKWWWLGRRPVGGRADAVGNTSADRWVLASTRVITGRGGRLVLAGSGWLWLGSGKKAVRLG